MMKWLNLSALRPRLIAACLLAVIGGSATLAARGLLRDREHERILDAFRGGAITAEQRDRRLKELAARWWDYETREKPT